MFGISPLGWLHTLGSLPAIAAALYMLARYGRIAPRSTPGIVYLISMLLGCITVFFIAQQNVSYGIAITTIVLLLIGYSVGYLSTLRNTSVYIETICLTLTVFLLVVPTVSETLRRVPNGDPIAADLNSPILLGTQGVLFVALILGITFQIIRIRKTKRSLSAQT
ncbi:MAG: hypothetical protein AAGC78_14955 [Cellvibrio sp.]|uniref:hypothetical protein n=1 Tax=Cellvibrio sp. TaxID=1965322 RepID=UPI0031A48194